MRRMADNRRRGFTTTGFTLIELLVVISIIALLLSLLLPSMSGARRTGQRVACSAALRRIAEGMGQYADTNEGWIVGSPAGSGAYLLGEAKAFGQSVQTWDFMGPLAQLWGMGLTVVSKGDPDGRLAQRFNELRSNGAFLCPGNRFLAFKFDGVEAGTGWMVSYNTYRYQLFTWVSKGASSSSNGQDKYVNDHEELLPARWKPMLDLMGMPANKIFCGDGARYSDCDTPPDYDLRPQAGWGGTFSDTGPYAGAVSSYWSKSWDRRRAPGNGSTSGSDARAYGFRHATGDPPAGARGNAFKANFAFYDGHVETLGDLEASNPFLWLPDGSRLNNANTLPDVVAAFGLSGTTLIGSEKPIE